LGWKILEPLFMLIRDAKNYYNKVDAVHVHLDFPEYYEDYYNEAKEVFLAERYEIAQSALDQERFSVAKEVLTEIAGFDPEYANLSELKSYAQLEPKYREAKAALGAKSIELLFTFSILFFKKKSTKTVEPFNSAAVKKLPTPSLSPFQK
jgi:hypothetical protein